MTERHTIIGIAILWSIYFGFKHERGGFSAKGQKGSNWEASPKFRVWAYHDFNRVVPSLPLVFVQEIL